MCQPHEPPGSQSRGRWKGQVPQSGAEQRLHREPGGVLSPGGRHADAGGSPPSPLGLALRAQRVGEENRSGHPAALPHPFCALRLAPGPSVIWAPAVCSGVFWRWEPGQRTWVYFLRVPGPVVTMALQLFQYL